LKVFTIIKGEIAATPLAEVATKKKALDLNLLELDPSINETNIKVSVMEGNITLNGYVPTYAEKR
jgi:osmotically-inducible protein OsmY